MSNVVEFEIDRNKLRQLLGDMFAKGIHEGDNWWLPTSNKKTIKLIIRERGSK